jgi:hypothetical protein
MRRLAPVLVLVLALAAAGCMGSGSSGPENPTIPPAQTFELAGFQPAAPVPPGPTMVAFTIDQPSGEPLTSYRRGAGPHTGVHVIVVRDDLSELIHRHPPIAADGSVSETIDFRDAGRYRVLVDAYPKLEGPLRNFQLHRDVQIGDSDQRQPVPPFQRTQTVDGYTVTLERTPRIRALRPTFIKATVTDPQGRPAQFTPYYGAIAHAIFFRSGSLDYFHTHVCGANTPGCTSVVANTNLTGEATGDGKLTIGVLLPVPGTWRLFLQFKSEGKVVTAPFTLKVR